MRQLFQENMELSRRFPSGTLSGNMGEWEKVPMYLQPLGRILISLARKKGVTAIIHQKHFISIRLAHFHSDFSLENQLDLLWNPLFYVEIDGHTFFLKTLECLQFKFCNEERKSLIINTQCQKLRKRLRFLSKRRKAAKNLCDIDLKRF